MDGGGKVADVLFPLGGERSGARGQGVQSDQWEPPSGSPEPSAGLGTLRAVQCVHLFMLDLFKEALTWPLGNTLAKADVNERGLGKG